MISPKGVASRCRAMEERSFIRHITHGVPFRRRSRKTSALYATDQGFAPQQRTIRDAVKNRSGSGRWTHLTVQNRIDYSPGRPAPHSVPPLGLEPRLSGF